MGTNITLPRHHPTEACQGDCLLEGPTKRLPCLPNPSRRPHPVGHTLLSHDQVCSRSGHGGWQFRPPKVVRMLSSLLKELFTIPFEQYSPFLPKCLGPGRRLYVGGWCSEETHPTKGTARPTGSTTRLRPTSVLGHSRTEIPRSALQPWNYLAPCCSASASFHNRETPVGTPATSSAS